MALPSTPPARCTSPRRRQRDREDHPDGQLAVIGGNGTPAGPDVRWAGHSHPSQSALRHGRRPSRERVRRRRLQPHDRPIDAPGPGVVGRPAITGTPGPVRHSAPTAAAGTTCQSPRPTSGRTATRPAPAARPCPARLAAATPSPAATPGTRSGRRDRVERRRLGRRDLTGECDGRSDGGPGTTGGNEGAPRPRPPDDHDGARRRHDRP